MSTHYETLGVPKTATSEEIKQSFRKLAKQHHPDLGGDAAKFQQINEAYEILSDADKRAHYDYTLNNPQSNFNRNFAHQGFAHNEEMFNHIDEQFSQMFGFSFRHARPARNRNIRLNLEVDFLDTLDNFQRTVEYNLTHGKETITLDFPAGLQDQTVLQIAGRGDNANNAIPRGDLEILIKIRPDARFVRADEHIIQEITIDCFQAILGTELDLETPRKKFIKLTIPPGTQNGSRFGITDEGFRKTNQQLGKFIVKINVKIPTALTTDQLELIKQVQMLKPVNG